MRAFRATALLLALVAPAMAMSDIRQGGTQGWELRSVSLSELSKLGLATGPSNRRPIFQNIDGGPPRRHHGGPPPGFQQVQLLGGGPGPRGPRGFPGANIPLDNLFSSAQIHRRPQAPPQLAQGPSEGGQGLNGLRLPPGWQAIQIDANQFSSIAQGKPVNIPGLGSGSVQIDSPQQQHFNQGGLQGPQGIQVIQGGSGQGGQQGPSQILQLPNNKLEIPQNTQTYQHGPFRFAHVSEEVQLIGQNGQKTIEVPVGTGHDQIKQVVQEQSQPQPNPVPAAEGGNIIPGGLPAAIQQFLKDNTPQFQLQDDEEAKGEQAQGQAHQGGHQGGHQVGAAPQHVQQHQVVHQQPQRQVVQQEPAPIHFQQQVQQQQLPVPQALVQPAGPGEGPIGNVPPGWKVIRVTADQLAAYQRGGPAPWLTNGNQNSHQQHQHVQQQQEQHPVQEQHHGPPQHLQGPQGHQQLENIQQQQQQHDQRGNFEASGPPSHHSFHGHQNQGQSHQGPPSHFQQQKHGVAPPVRIPPRANVKVVYLPLGGNSKTVQHQQNLYREERREQPKQQQEWQAPAIQHGAWKAITPNYAQQNNNGPWNKVSASNGGQAYATSERYHQRGNHIEEHRHEHPPSGHHQGGHNNGPHNNNNQGNHHHGGQQRARGVVTRENAQKWFS